MILKKLVILMLFVGSVIGNCDTIFEVVMQITLIDQRGIKAVNLMSSDRNRNVHEVNDFKTKFSKKSQNLDLLVRLFHFSDKKVNPSKARLFYNVIMIDSIESFHQIVRKFSSENFYFGGYYLIIFEAASFEELSEIFKTLWDFYIHNVNILTCANANCDSIHVSTIFPFTESGCNKTNPIRVAEFKDGRFVYQPAMFFPDKFENLRGCQLKVSTFESLSPSVLREDFSNGSYRLYGRDVEVMNALAEKINFTMDIFYVVPYGGWGIIYPNKTASGAFGRAARRESDFILGNVFLKLERAELMEFSYPYFMDQLVLVIPPGKPLTSFQKLLRPFEDIVWFNLAGIVLCAFIVIAFLNFQSNRVKEFVFGKAVGSPFLNVFIAIFGGTQHRLPNKNFSRCLLMIFLIECLVLR